MTLIRERNALDATLTNVSNESTLAGVLDAADLNYEVALQELYSQVITPNGVTTVQYEHSGVIRMDNLAPLGVVGERYTPIQNADAFEPLQYLHDEGFIAEFEQAGSVNGGQRAFIVARLNRDISLTDEHHARVLFSTSHDGSGAYSVRAIAQRLFCANQIPRLNRLGLKVSSIRHTHSATQRVAQVKHAVLAEMNWFDEYTWWYDKMLATPAGTARTSAYVNQVAPLPPKDKATQRQMNTAVKRQREVMGRINGPHNTNIAGSVAALFQGAVEYSDYDARGNNAERILLGRDLTFKQRAWDAALALV
jgi:phage/plasmid-like protein (TIGR03299 family)